MTTVQESYRLFQDEQTRPTLTGALVDDNDCCCAQGAILHYGCGVSFDDLRVMEQGEADCMLMRELGISRFHSVLIRIVNDSQEGCPEDVVVGELDPAAGQRVLGPNAAELFRLGRGMDSLDWDAARDAARAAAWAAMALVVKDLILWEHYLTLTRPMYEAGLKWLHEC